MPCRHFRIEPSFKKLQREIRGGANIMRRYIALSGNTEIVYYSGCRLGSKGNKEDMEREIRQRYSSRDAKEILNSIDSVMRDYSD